MTLLTLTPDNSTSTAFRAWGSAISAQLAAQGLVKTADTGQIDWTTVAAPTGISQSKGYEIWRFADTLQASAPIYFKLEYGSDNINLSHPRLWFTVGTGSDGAGAITGTFFAGAPTACARVAIDGFGGGTPYAGTSVYVMGGTNALAVLLWPNFTSSASGGAYAIIERTHDFAGADTADGYSLITGYFGGSGSSFSAQIPVPFAAVGLSAVTTQGSMLTLTGGRIIGGVSSVINSTLYPQPVFTQGMPKVCGPSQWLLAYRLGDLLQNQTLAITHYGTGRNFLSLGYGNTAQGSASFADAFTGALFRIS